MLDTLIFAAAAAFGSAASCTPIPGADDLLADKSLQWIVVGEMHGTKESPQIFGDLACLAAASGRAPMVALEIPEDEAAGINAFLASDGGGEAVARLLAHPFWHRHSQDGRSSEAMAHLLERLRQMKAHGLIRGVVPFQPVKVLPGPSNEAAAAYEKAMAENVRALSTSNGDLVLVLVGNLHARLVQQHTGLAQYPPMASFLPKDRTVSLNATGNGGSEWACIPDSTGQAGHGLVCQPTRPWTSPVQRARGIVRLTNAESPYSGYLNMGAVTTPAPPAATN